MAFKQRLTHTCMQDDRHSRRPFVVPSNPHRPSSAPPGGLRQRAPHGNGRLSPSPTRPSFPTRNIRTAYSLPPATKEGGPLRGRDISFYSRLSTPRWQNSPVTSGAPNGETRSASPRTSEAGVFGRRTRGRSEEDVSVGSQGISSPVSAERDFWPPREESMEPTAGMSMPGRFLEVVEDRDRAVHMCLQYRSKLRGTEKRLRDAEHRAFDLARQLGEAAAAEAATRKLLDRAMEKPRVGADRAHTRQTSRGRHGNGTPQSSTFDDSKKARLQLARARRDLRELWLERDELAVMASQAMQAESDGRERIKKLELVIQGLQERVASMKNVERGMSEEMAEVEAKAASAVKSKHELHSKVVEIKCDFEVLAQDLRQRDRTVQRLETENATLVAEIASRKANRVDVPPDPPHQGERRVGWRAVGQDRSTQISYSPECLVCSANQNETESGVETHQSLSERGRAVIVKGPVENASDVVASPVREWTNHLDVREVERACDSSLPDEQAHMVQTRGEHPSAGSSRTLCRQLTPEASALPGRETTTPSFPMKGSHEMFNRQLAESATPEKRVDVEVMSNVVPASNEEKLSEPLSRASVRVTTRENPHEAGRELLRRPPPPMPSLPSPPHRSAGYNGERSVSPSLVPSQHCRTGGSIKPPRRQQTNPNNYTQEIDGERRHNLFTERVDEYEFVERRNTNRLDVREIVKNRRGSSFDSTAYSKRKPESIADITMPLSMRLERPESYSNAFVPRLLEGVPVLKHSVKGKPKEKTLWVTPDLSEIYYTSVGRTRNSKQTSRMPLAELRAERGRDRDEHPNLSTNSSTDNQRFFSLVRIHGESRAEASARRSGSLIELHSSSSDDDGRERHFRTGDRSTSGRLIGMGGSSAGTTSRRGSLPFGSGARVRERMSFEMATGEERDAIVEEINRLARGKVTRCSPEIFAAQRGP